MLNMSHIYMNAKENLGLKLVENKARPSLIGLAMPPELGFSAEPSQVPHAPGKDSKGIPERCQLVFNGRGENNSILKQRPVFELKVKQWEAVGDLTLL